MIRRQYQTGSGELGVGMVGLGVRPREHEYLECLRETEIHVIQVGWLMFHGPYLSKLMFSQVTLNYRSLISLVSVFKRSLKLWLLNIGETCMRH